MEAATHEAGRVVGRYLVFDEIASGGMASVHLGRLMGEVGFSRTVAIKRLHPHLARDREFSAMFLDEARLAARVRHPNVVAVLDVVQDGGELLLVMDYVQGESLSRLARAMRPGGIPPRLAVTVVTGMLHGLHAAHEAVTEQGAPLEIVHRDVSPQNVLVGVDGGARVFDFGVAKAAHRVQTTQDGAIKGKISYMAPEQLLSEAVDRRADVYAAAVVLWEALTGERLFEGENQGRIIRKILDEDVPLPSSVTPGLPKSLDEAVMRGLERNVEKRWQTARDFALALELAIPVASATQLGEWVESIGGSALEERAKRVKYIETIEHPVKEAESGKHERPTVVEHDSPSERMQAATVPVPGPSSSSRLVAPLPPPSSGKLKTRLNPSDVHVVAVTPLASLQEAAAKRTGHKRMMVIGVVLAVLGLLAVAGSAIWTLLHRH